MQTAGGMFSEESTTSESERAVRRWEWSETADCILLKLNSQFGSLVNFKKKIPDRCFVRCLVLLFLLSHWHSHLEIAHTHT